MGQKYKNVQIAVNSCKMLSIFGPENAFNLKKRKFLQVFSSIYSIPYTLGKSGPASTVEEHSLQNFRSEGTAVRDMP